MSETISTTVKSTNLKHASASGNNVVLDSSGGTSLSGSLSVTGTTTLTGAVELPDDTVDIADLSATGTASSSTYLRGDNTWTAPDSGQIIYKGTAVATTSGTSVEFTGIPAAATRLTLLFAEVSASGTDNIKVQLGHSGAYYTSNYNSTGGWLGEGEGYSEIGLTDGFAVHNVYNGAGNSLILRMTLTKLNNTDTGTSWIEDHQGTQANVNVRFGGGILTSVSTAVDRLKVIFTGSNTFDAGSMNLTWEL